jgi:uncharacterized membrane protein
LEAVKNCMTHPWILPEIILGNKTKIITVICTYFPFAFLSFFSPLVILTIPSILERMLNDQSWMWTIQAHQYSAVISPIIAFSAGDGLFIILKRFQLESERKKWKLILCAVILAINLAALPVAPLGKLFHPSYYRLTSNDLTGVQALKLIPDGASVLAQTTIVPHLSHRNLIWRIDEDSLNNEKSEDYIVTCQNLDFGPPHNFETIDQYLNLKQKRGYEKIFDQAGWIVLRKGGIQ